MVRGQQIYRERRQPVGRTRRSVYKWLHFPDRPIQETRFVVILAKGAVREAGKIGFECICSPLPRYAVRGTGFDDMIMKDAVQKTECP